MSDETVQRVAECLQNLPDYLGQHVLISALALGIGIAFSLPLAILASGLMLLAAGSVFLGILLHAINWRLRQMHNVLTRRKRLGRRRPNRSQADAGPPGRRTGGRGK